MSYYTKYVFEASAYPDSYTNVIIYEIIVGFIATNCCKIIHFWHNLRLNYCFVPDDYVIIICIV